MQKQIRKSKKRKIQPQKEIVSKGIYENGEIKLSGKRLPKKKMNVVVSFREYSKEQKQNEKSLVDNFLKKWSGTIKEQDIQIVMEKKLEYLSEKHK